MKKIYDIIYSHCSMIISKDYEVMPRKWIKNLKEMWPLNECVFYVQIQAGKTGLF